MRRHRKPASTGTAAWLLIGWCVAGAAAIVAAYAPAIVCPYGQEGCDLRPQHGPALVLPVVLAGLAVSAGLWWWSRRNPPGGDDEPGPAPRTVRMRVLLPLSAAAVVVMAHLVLLAPQPDEPFCMEVRLNAAMAYPFNCDSPLLMELAHRPGEVFEPGNFRQSRPGYVLLGAGLTATVGPVADAIGLDRLYGQTDDAYIPLVLLNLLLAALAVALLAGLLFGVGAPPVVVGAVSAFMVVNDMTKAFTWSPHQQMFTLLVPVGTMFAVRWMMRSRPPWWGVALLGLGAGVAGLFYGSVLITMAAVGLVLLSQGWRRVLGLGPVLVGAFAAPQLAWMAICRTVAGSYRMAETAEYHQFVWLPESAMDSTGALYRRVRSYSLFTVREVVEAAWPMILLLALLVALAVVARADLVPTDPATRATVLAAGLTVLCGLAFCWGIGTWTYRLAYHLVPPLLLLTGWVAGRIGRRSPAWSTGTGVLLSVVAAGWVVYEIARSGPYA